MRRSKHNDYESSQKKKPCKNGKFDNFSPKVEGDRFYKNLSDS